MTEFKEGSSSTPGTPSAFKGPEPSDEAVSALKSSVMADAHELTDGAKHIAGDAMAQARESAQAQISGGKDRLAEGLGSVAEAIRHTGEQLREGDQPALTDYVTRAADGVEAASDYLKEKSIGDVLGDVGSFARREPAMFLGGAFVLGLLGGRFLKSSHLRPATGNGGQRASQGFAGPSAPSDGRRAEGRSLGSSTSLNRNSSSGNRPISGDKPREIGGLRAAPHDGAVKLPGTL